MHGTVILRDRYNGNGSLKKMKINQSNCLNTTFPNTIKAVILDLKEIEFAYAQPGGG